MSRDNTEDDVVEIDLGSIGRRIGGFFGSKSGTQKKEAPESGKGPQENEGPAEDGQPEKIDGAEKEMPKEGADSQGRAGLEEEKPKVDVAVAEKEGNAQDILVSEKDMGTGAPESKPESSSDGDYFEIDLGRLLGRKKQAEAVAPEKAGEEGPAAEPEKKEDAPAEKPPEEKEGAGTVEVDFGKLFGGRKKGHTGKASHPEKDPSPSTGNGPEKPSETDNDENGDGSIEIDFGRLFGRKKGPEKKHAGPERRHPKGDTVQVEDAPIHGHPKKEAAAHHANKKEPEKGGAGDTVEIDLGKIGSSIAGLFGGGRSKEELKREKREEKEEEDYLRTVELDVDSIGKSIIRHRKMVVFVLLAAIISFSLYVRLLSAGSPLSPDYDTYLHYRYARDVINNNMHLPDWDEKSYYPPGRGRAEAGGYPLMEAYLYKFLQLVYPDITLINAAMVLTVLFGGLATIPAFFIGKDASGDLGGLFSAFLVGTIPAILTRSVGSYADTDAMVLFFSLLIVAFYVKAVEAAKEKFSFKLVGYSILAVLATIVLVYTWGATFEYLLQLLVPLPFLLFGIYVLSGSGSLAKRLQAGFMRTRYVFLATLVLFLVPFFVYGILNPDERGHYQVRPLSWGIDSVRGIIGATAQKYLSPLSVAGGLKSESGGVGGAGRNVYISVAEMQPPVLENYTSQFGIVIYLALAFFIAGSSLLLYRFVPGKGYGQLTFGLSLALIIGGILVTRVDVMTPEMRGFLAKFFVVFGSLFFMAGVMRRSDALGSIAKVFFENDLQERALLIVLMWGGGLFFVSTLGIRFLMLLGPPLCIAAGVLLDRMVKSSSVISRKFSPLVLGLSVVALVVFFMPSAYALGSSARGSMDPQWHDMLTWVKLNSAPDATVTTWWDPGHWVTAIAQRRSGADGAHYPGGPMPISMRIRDFGWSFTTTNESESVDTLSKYRGNSSEMFYISSNDLIGKFVWLSYFSTGTKQQYIILGESGSYPQNGATLHMYQMSQNVAVVVRESGDELEPWLYVNNNKLRIKEMVYFDQNGRTVKQASKDGEDALVWMQGDKKLIVYMPGSVKDNILTRTYFFGGEGLERFKLEFVNQEIKLYQVKF